MSFKSFCTKMAVGAVLLAIGVSADQLTVSGTVTDSSGNAVADAIVRVLGGGGGGMRIDTTDASGAYSITFNSTAAMVTVLATSGTQTATATDSVSAPNDSTDDEVTMNLVIGSGIQPDRGDTTVVSGTVKDSAGAAVANAVVTIRFGRMGGGGALRDTTDDSGAYSITSVNTNSATTVTVTATLNNRTGTATDSISDPSDGTTDLVTVDVIIGSGIQPTRGDTVIISGTVKDSTGAAVADAVVTVSFGGGGGFSTARDTTDASGAYSITVVNTSRSTTITVSSRVDNVTGSVTQSIAAPADGTTDRLTADIIIGERRNPVRLTSPSAPVRGSSSITGVYLLNGRRIDKAVLTRTKASTQGTAIVRYRNESQTKLLLDR